VHEWLAQGLTVEVAVAIALLENRSLQATYEDLSIAQTDLVQAGLLANPVVAAGVGFPVAGIAQTGVNVSVSQDFLGLFSLAARKKVAAAELTATELRVADAVLRTTYAVESAYYTLAAAQQVLAMRKAILATADASLDLARRQHGAGDISELDLANQEVVSEQLRVDVARSLTDVIVSREALALLLGVDAATLEGHTPEKLPELPSADPATTDLDALTKGRRLDLGAAREDVVASTRALELARRSRWLGSTSAGVTYDHAPEGFTTVGPNLGVELPLFDQKQAVLGRLEARVHGARAREAALESAIVGEVHVAVSRLASARVVVQRYAEVVVPLRQRVVALSQSEYNAMLLGTPQLLLAKQGELNAFREFIEALRDYWVARADLERATGGTLPTTLAPESAPAHDPRGGP
jgi:cobalt-zinc-cadmium efflux system outer membrane protein